MAWRPRVIATYEGSRSNRANLALFITMAPGRRSPTDAALPGRSRVVQSGHRLASASFSWASYAAARTPPLTDSHSRWISFRGPARRLVVLTDDELFDPYEQALLWTESDVLLALCPHGGK